MSPKLDTVTCQLHERRFQAGPVRRELVDLDAEPEGDRTDRGGIHAGYSQLVLYAVGNDGTCGFQMRAQLVRLR